MTNFHAGSFLTLPEPVRDATPRSVAALRERCAGIGMPTWRCDTAGVILQEPLETGTIPLLLGSPPMTALVGRMAREWAQSDSPAVAEMFPGCWGVPLAEYRRKDRIGTIVGMALSETALSDEFFLRCCDAAQIDAQATRRALLSRARFDERSAGTMRDLLLTMAGDLSRLEDHDETVSGFTRQLTDCYETIDLLYTMGRSMRDLAQPEAFVNGLCERLHSTLEFGAIGAVFVTDPRLGPAISDHRFMLGRTTLDLDCLRAELLDSDRLDAGSPVIVTQIGGKTISGAGQVLAMPVYRSGGLVGFLFACDKHGDDNQVSSYDIQLLEAAAGYVAAFMDNAVLYADQQRLFLGTLEALTASIDAKDRYTCGHSQRVSHLSTRLALAVGYTAEQADRIRIAGLVHDVGKIGVPEAVLTKAGRLSDEEFGAIKLHPEIGHRILKDIPLLADVLPGVLHHHERWDGKGYPAGLSAEAIPHQARIIALADTFDAMSSNRSYRSALSRGQVLEEIARCAGSQFDPALVPAFLAMDFAEYDAMVAQAASQKPYEIVRAAA